MPLIRRGLALIFFDRKRKLFGHAFFLAGDWTATGWPATMEGAVRSGYIAAEAVARAAGLTETSFIVDDLKATGFMRLFG